MTKTIGLISLSGWDDPTAQDLSHIFNDSIKVQTSMLAPIEGNPSLDSMAACEDLLGKAAIDLAKNGCDIVACVGTSLGWAGQPNTNAARLRAKRIARSAGVPLIMTGTAIIDMLGLLGSRRPALACTYHPSEWKTAWHHYVFNTGFDVTIAENFQDAGLAGPMSLPEALRNPEPALIERAIMKIAERAPESDAIVVTGMGASTFGQINQLEAAAGMPILGADTALYGALALAIDVPLAAGCLGALTPYLTPMNFSSEQSGQTG